MKLKTLMGVIATGCIFSSVAFGQTLQITGTVTAATSTQITLQCGTDTWIINRTATTKATSGDLTSGSTVTLQCNSPDAQKKEAPSTLTPTPSG